MQSDSQFLDAALFIQNARLGEIMPPPELYSALRSLAECPPIGNLAVAASVPNWLVEKMDPSIPLATSYVVFPTSDRVDALLPATMQSANCQLRCVMQLSHPQARAFWNDALQVGLFTCLFYIENTRQQAIMSTPLHTNKDALRQQLLHARQSTCGLAPAVQLTSLACDPAFVPSLVDGHNVDDLVTVLAHQPTKRDLELASMSGEQPSDAPVH